MAEEVVIVGAGGHGRVCLDICLLTDTPLRGFLDSGRDMGEQIHGVPVLGGDELLSDAGFRAGASFIVGIGDRHIRPRVIAALIAVMLGDAIVGGWGASRQLGFPARWAELVVHAVRNPYSAKGWCG